MIKNYTLTLFKETCLVNKATLVDSNYSYLTTFKEVKRLLSDYLSNILIHKPVSY